MADPNLRTTYLDQFSWERANAIAERLEAAGIAWNYKQFGWFTRFFFNEEWGVRLYVDSMRVDEARSIAAETPEPPAENESS